MLYVSACSPLPSDAIESTMDLMEKLDYHHHSDDILVDQTRNFLRNILGL